MTRFAVGLITLAFLTLPATPVLALECEQPETGSIAAPNTAVHGFSAANGERVRIGFRRLGGDAEFAPGFSLSYRDPDTGDPVFIGGFGGGPREFVLTQSPSGTYEIEVSTLEGGGSYEVDLVRLTPQFACGPILNCDDPIQIDFDIPLRVKTLRFAAQAGERISINPRPIGGDLDRFFSHAVYRPDGSAVPFFQRGRGEWEATQSGEHMIAVTSFIEAGPAEIRMLRLTGPSACVPTLCPGDSMVAEIDVPDRIRAFAFQDQANEVATIFPFRLAGDAGFDPAHNLLSPSGDYLDFFRTGRRSWVLPESGPYTAVVAGFGQRGTFEVTLESLTGPNPCLEDRLVVYDPVFPRAQGKVDAQGALSAIPGDYEAVGALRDGAVADGVTRLVLKFRTDSPEPATFSLPAGQSDGSLFAVGSADPVGVVQVDPVAGSDGELYAYAIYQAPPMADAALDSGIVSRLAEVRIQHDQGLQATRFIELHRPPVVLVHGLWDTAEGWDWFAPRLEDLGWTTTRAEYPNASSFDPRLPFALNAPVSSLWKTVVEDALPAVRQGGIAATQVYLVAHSLGGLVSRSLAQQPDGIYRRADNYLEGDVHSLVTIGTPHLGTELADLGFRSPCLLLPPNLLSLVVGVGDTLSGAIFDLRTTSGAIASLNEGPQFAAPIHTVVGLSPLTEQLKLGVALRLLFKELDKVEECGIDFATFEPLSNPLVLYNGFNDMAVGEASQRAGRDGPAAVSTFPDVVHSSAVRWLTPLPHERISEDILNRVAEVLGDGTEFTLDR